MYNYILFDLDGTLTNPADGITNSVAYALDKFGIAVDDKKSLYKFIGPPLADSFQNFYGFSKEQSYKAIEYYREYFKVLGIFCNNALIFVYIFVQFVHFYSCTFVIYSIRQEVYL